MLVFFDCAHLPADGEWASTFVLASLIVYSVLRAQAWGMVCAIRPIVFSRIAFEVSKTAQIPFLLRNRERIEGQVLNETTCRSLCSRGPGPYHLRVHV